jgi:proteasome lid subunit RPN8/RPN11
MNTPALTLPERLLDAMIAHARWGYPLEVCGLLGGAEGIASHLYAIDNINQSRTRFQMAPEQQLQAMLALEEQGLALLAFYHSHPQGPERPSPTDVAQAYYPDVIQFIVSLRDRARPAVGAFTIREEKVTAVAYAVKSV